MFPFVLILGLLSLFLAEKCEECGSTNLREWSSKKVVCLNCGNTQR